MVFLYPTCAASSVGLANSLVKHFLTTIIALHCKISTPDLWPENFGTQALEFGLDEYDFVVVGSGTAGSVVAARLAENLSHRVLLLETGGDPPIESEVPGLAFGTLNSKIDWSYTVDTKGRACLGYKECTWNTGKVIGGTHAIDYMIYLRGNPQDYDQWEKLGSRGWNWHNVSEYFKKTENFLPMDFSGEHGKGGPLSIEPFPIPRKDQNVISAAAFELGYNIVDDFVAGNYLGFGQIYGTLQNGRRMSSAKAFLRKPKSNLDVIKHAVASEILFNDAKRANGIRFMYRNRNELTVRVRKEVILASGAIETAKLLMISGIGPKSELKSLGIPVLQDLEVGENLLSHTRVTLFLKLDRHSTYSVEIEALDAFYDQWVHRTGQLSSVALDIAGFINTDRSGKYPDIQYLFIPIRNISQLASRLDNGIASSLTRQLGSNERLLACTVNLLQPKSVGHIRLRSKDYRDKPKIYPNYFDSKDDVKTITRGIKRLLEFESTLAFRKLNAVFLKLDLPECDTMKLTSSDYWKCYIKYLSDSVYTFAGTTKMGSRSDKHSVVNSKLKVRGIDGLRVVGGSIMPTLPTANSRAPAIMVAEKGADMIKKDWINH